MEISREHPFLRHFQYFVVLVKMVKSSVLCILLVWSQAQRKKIPKIQVQILLNHRLYATHLSARVSVSTSGTCQSQFCSPKKRSAVSPGTSARLLLHCPLQSQKLTGRSMDQKALPFSSRYWFSRVLVRNKIEHFSFFKND